MDSEATPAGLFLGFHGRVIDHLGIQMYQSPVAAVAEMVSNAWDADAESVNITLPDQLGDEAIIAVADNGNGMTFRQCQDRFLEVGFDRRKGSARSYSTLKKRPVLGRKGIGKFAGFGIARVIEIETVSGETGERTVFSLDADKLRSDEYVGIDRKPVDLLLHEPSDPARKSQRGTTVRLRHLTMAQRPSEAVFLRSMARRFLLHQQVDDFSVKVNGTTLPADEDGDRIEFIFPRDYGEGQAPAEMTIADDGFGVETVGEERQVKWKFAFYKEPIHDDELKGVAVFAHGKLAQTPFAFNLIGGIGSQQGLEYLSGRVSADYIDELPVDIIAPERQRVDWQRSETVPLLAWGQRRVLDLLALWQDQRSADKVAQLTDRVSPFRDRLHRLPRSERQIIEGALRRLAGMTKLSSDDFRGMAEAMLTAWEGGRLRDLIANMASAQAYSADEFVQILMEAEVITALHAAEIVRVKLEAIDGLRSRVDQGDRENPLRDYVSENPWFFSPKWETYQREVSLRTLLADAAKEARLEQSNDWDRRVDLVLSSGDSVLVLEFMKPGVTINLDHVSRFAMYVTAIKVYLHANAGRLRRVEASYLVADGVHRSNVLQTMLEEQAVHGKYILDWDSLIDLATAQWRDFIGVLADRSPHDDRLKALAEPEASISNGPESPDA